MTLGNSLQGYKPVIHSNKHYCTQLRRLVSLIDKFFQLAMILTNNEEINLSR